MDTSPPVLLHPDNNYMDDVGLYAKGQSWLNNKHIMGRAVGFLPSVGMVSGLGSMGALRVPVPARGYGTNSVTCMEPLPQAIVGRVGYDGYIYCLIPVSGDHHHE